jgi:membrane protease YdiL (CAAX protease family)
VTPSLVFAAVWMLLANVLAMLPSTDNYWRRAYVLMVSGVPLAGWVFYENGLWWGLGFVAAGVSVLRWALLYFWRKLRGKLG